MRASLLVLPVILGACALPKPPDRVAALDPKVASQIPGSFASNQTRSEPDLAWVQSFRDPALDQWVAMALQDNPDLTAAAARVEASRASIRITGSKLYPWIAARGAGQRQVRDLRGDLGLGIDPADISGGVDGSGVGSGNRSVDRRSETFVYGGGLALSWEIDLWGRVRAGKAAALNMSEAAEADYIGARQSLAAATTRAWFGLIEARQQTALARETVQLYAENLRLNLIRQEQGAVSDYEVSQIRSRVKASEDTLFAVEAAEGEAVRALEVLVGRYPSGSLESPVSLPAFPGSVPVGMPLELLERRPDLISAERRFAASFNRVTEARTARLPRLTLSASGLWGTANLSGVGVLESVAWSLGSGLTQPIFFGGQLKASQDLREAEQRAAAAEYTGAALEAFREVETLLAAEPLFEKRQAAVEELVRQSDQTVQLARIRRDVGKEDMFTVLEITGKYVAAQSDLIRLRGARLRMRVDLHLALGGGFGSSANP
jgi:outer membrane protein, multidrug efflux system